MLKWTSVLAFVVACCVGVTAFCDDAPAKKAPEYPATTHGRLIDEAKTRTQEGLQRLRKFTDEKSPRPANEISSISCANGSAFKQRADGCFLASGANPEKEVLTLTLKPARAGSVLRLDFPLDESLPGGGPGRAGNGNFVVSEVEIEGMRVVDAWANAGDDTSKAIDGISDKEDNYWNSSGYQHHQRTLLLTLEKPAPVGAPLTVRLICRMGDAHVPGCISAAVLPGQSIVADVAAGVQAERDKARQAELDKARQESFRLFAKVYLHIGPPPADAPGELQLKPGDKIVAIGDSITAGGGYLRNIDTVLAGRYPGLYLPQIINKGIGGQKAEDLVKRFDRDVVQLKPAVVTINVGINDVWHRLGQPHNENVLAAYNENVTRMVDAAQKAGIRVILLTPTVIQEAPTSEGNQRLAKYVAALKEIAAEKKCQLVDLHGMFLTALKTQPLRQKGWLTRDGVHMNPLGDGIMAAGALRALGVPDERKWVIYVLPHSHVDIGYTHVQTDVEKAHWKFYEEAIEASRRTANYPAGAQFKWNVEVLWATDSYLKQATPEKQQEFVDAVKKGWIGLQALYGNELTALCRPEELVRLVDYAGRLGQRCDMPVDTAMISDVPGYTWGLMSVFADAGVKYFSIGPNRAARIGWSMATWQDKPFYWTTPDGKSKILCWIPEKGYGSAKNILDPEKQVFALLRRLEAKNYPYDLIQIRYCLGDNGGPLPDLCETVKNWNAKYAYPKLVIATASEMMRELERRHADKIPVVRGDFTPYWEDGAGSSARETALNRAAAERLSQAEAIWAVKSPKTYPADEFYAAWRNVLLYDEHTWGAHCSVSQPDSPFTKSQWAIKQAFALDAGRQSRELLKRATTAEEAKGKDTALTVFNTTSWPRTGLCVVPAKDATPGKIVRYRGNKPVNQQRLSTGELAFLVADVPAFGAKQFVVETGDAKATGTARAEGNKLSAAGLTVTVDEKTGSIASLTRQGVAADLVDTKAGQRLNDYLYVLNSNSKRLERNGPVTIKVKERGPLVASLLIECDAPGCRKLTREIRVIDGQDCVELINLVDKAPVRTKEGVHFGFPFNVPKGVVRMDIAWAVVRPEEDQMPGACKNWFTVQRWVDVSNDRYGVTMATVDAPLMEVGGLTGEHGFGSRDPKEWIERLAPSQTLYSWVMNNHWFTNYKAYQEGPTVFRYALRPHAGSYNGVEAARFGIEQSQPLVMAPTTADASPLIPSRLKLESDNAVVASLKPSNDRKALIVRLFGASGQPGKAAITWAKPTPKAVCISDLTERPTQTMVGGLVEVPAYGIVTLCAELGE